MVKISNAPMVCSIILYPLAQERNLKRLCECLVVDRTGLFLDILLS